jgi:hypothetical protein
MPKLLKLSNEARKIGSSAPLISSCHEIRHRFTVLLFLFQQTKPFFELEEQKKKKVPPVARSAVGNVLRKDLPDQLRDLAECIIAFLDALNYFPEIMNRDVSSTLDSNSSMLSYREDLIVSYL